MSTANLEQVAQLAEQLSTDDQRRLVERLSRQLGGGTEDERIAQLRAAAEDPLFLADVREIGEDFRHADAEQTR